MMMTAWTWAEENLESLTGGDLARTCETISLNTTATL